MMEPVHVAHSMNELMLCFVWQLAVILVAARLGGFMTRRYLRLPSVFGELVAGMVIGPYALGGFHLPGFGALFPKLATALPVTPELYAIATLAAVILLFLSGLETDLQTFLRYSAVGSAVGLGGVVFSFTLGDLCAVWFGLADHFMDPAALFLGIISTATSVGITARVLTDRRAMDSPEGVTLLAAVVLDDVLGIVMLTVVMGLTQLDTSTGGTPWARIAWVAGKAIGFWLVGTTVSLLLARRFTQMLKVFRSTQTIAALAFGCSLMLAGLSEMAGLAMIIGAYIAGLALSRTDVVHVVRHELQSVYDLLVPIFFCIMGMLVDVRSMQGMLGFTVVYTAVAVLTKVLGCGLPAWAARFNLLGSLRIGVGMLPRGEVALIIAGIGLSGHLIDQRLFGAAVGMTMLTTLLGPPLLAQTLNVKRSGLRREADRAADRAGFVLSFDLPSEDMADFLIERLVRAFRKEEYFVYRVAPDVVSYQVRKDDVVFTMSLDGSRLDFHVNDYSVVFVRLMLLEEVLSMEQMLGRMRELDGLTNRIAAGI